MKQSGLLFLLIALAMLNTTFSPGVQAADGEYIEVVQPDKVLSFFPDINVRYKDLNIWGVGFSLLRKQSEIGSARVGVFSDSAKAQALFQKKMMMSSMPPPSTKDLSEQIGDRSIMWRDGIFFCRDNVFVDIRLPNVDVRQIARQLDKSLKLGEGGAKRGSEVQIPEILDLEFVNGGPIAKLGRDVSGMTSFVDASGLMTPHYQSVEAICFATERCVMSEPMKCDKTYLSAKMEEAKAKENKDEEPSAEARRQQVDEAMATLRKKGSSPYHRNKAVLALGNSGDRSTVQVLIAELEHTNDPVVKQNAIKALGWLRDKQAVPCLLKIVEAPVQGKIDEEAGTESIFRRQAVLALGEIGDPSALSVLKKVAKSDKEYQSVRELAEITIRKLEKYQLAKGL